MSRKMAVPGPGSYTQRSGAGHYVESTIPNMGCPIFHKPKKDRIQIYDLETKKIPGPGAYSI